MMLVPLLLLLVGLALAGNYAYVLLSRRSRARLALRELVQSLKPRQLQLHRLVEKLMDASPQFGESLARLHELSEMRRERGDASSDEELLLAENALGLEMDRLVQASERNALNTQPAWAELQALWTQTQDDIKPAASLYNAQVRKFNDSLAAVPGKWVAPLLSLEPLPMMQR